MPEQWVTIAEAAASMKIHPRTVERRAVAGKLKARRNDDGQVQVLLDIAAEPEPTPSPAPDFIPPDAFETVKEMADRQVDIAAGSASALVRSAQEQAMRAEHQLNLARQESNRFRRETQMALALVAVMLLFVIVAVGWCTHTITDARDRAVAAELAAHNSSLDLVRTTEQLNVTSDKLLAANIDRARAEGQLMKENEGIKTVIEQTRPHPTTQPTGLLARIGHGLSEWASARD